jgi:hypothetical protein
MFFETENLALDSDGDVWLRFLDEDGERDVRRLGDVEGCSYEVPDEMYDEYLEISQEWRRAVRDRKCYESGMGSYWGR